MPNPTFPFDEKLVQELLARLAEARPPGTAIEDLPSEALQAANLEAFSATQAAMAQGYLSLAKAQVEGARKALDAPNSAEAVKAWFEKMAEASIQSGADAQAEMFANIAPKRDEKKHGRD